MNSAMEILETISASGGQLWLVDGEKLRYCLPARLGPMLGTMREHKAEIIELLAQQPVMPPDVRLVRYAPVTAPVQLSRCEKVVDPRRFIVATLAQVDARLHDKDWLAGNWPLSELLARLAAVGCHVALEDGKVMLQ